MGKCLLMIVKIEHTRCDEWSAVTYCGAPDDWTEEQVYEAVHKAEKAYLEALQLAKDEADAPNDYKPYGGPPYDRYPDKTVKEIKEKWAEKKKVYDEWNARQRATHKSFQSFLEDQGFSHLEEHADMEVELHWGHRHGTSIDYGEPQIDSMKTPRKMAGIKDEPRFL